MCRPFATSILHHPIFIVSSFIGIFPFRSVNGVVELDKLLFCYSCALTAMFPLMGWLALESENDDMNSLPFTVFELLMFLHIFQHPCFFISISLKRKLVLETIDLIQRLKFVMNKLKANNCINHKVFFSDLLNILHPVLTMIIFCSTGKVSLNPFLPVLFVFSLLLGSSLCTSQCCFLLGTVHELLEAEITILRSIKRTVYGKRNVKIMEQVIETANQITLVAKRINSIYSFQHLFLISARYMLVVIFLYFIIVGITINFWFVIGDLVMIFFHSYNSWKICHASEITTQKVGEYL